MGFAMYLAVVISAFQSNGAEYSFRSHVRGYECLSSILNDSELQSSIELSPSQLRELKDLRQKLQSLDLDADRLFKSLDTRIEIAKQLDPVATQEISRILAKEQLELLRTNVLRANVPRPLHAFREEVLRDFDLSADEITLLRTDVTKVVNKLSEEVAQQRNARFKEILDMFTKPQQQKFVDVFGDVYLPKGVVPQGHPLEIAQVFSDGRNVELQIAAAHSIKLRQQEREQLATLVNKLMVSRSKQAQVEIQNGLDQFSNESKLAILRYINRSKLDNDLRVIIHPDLVKKLDLNADQVARVGKICEIAQAELSELKNKREREFYQEMTSKLPKRVQREFVDFFRGIWD